MQGSPRRVPRAWPLRRRLSLPAVHALRAVSPDNDSDSFAWHGLQFLVVAFQVDGSTDNASRSRRGRRAAGQVRLNGIVEAEVGANITATPYIMRK